MEESWELKPKIEALLVASDRPVSITALAACLGVTEDETDEALREFEADLLGADRGIQVRRRPHGVRIETKAQYADLIGRLLPERRPKPITSQALETLAIIALKQPVSTGDINAIRGIESAGTVETLQNRRLIALRHALGPAANGSGGPRRPFWTPLASPRSTSHSIQKDEWIFFFFFFFFFFKDDIFFFN